MLERLPEHLKTGATARAITAPAAILLGGAGMAAAIVAGAPLAVAGIIGAAAWATRVALGLPRRARGERIDPFTVGEPWRSFVMDAQNAQRRFHRSVGTARSGPLRDRLSELGDRIDTGVRECWRIARQGHELDRAYVHLDVQGIRAELATVEAEWERARSDAERAALERTREAIEAQAASATRLASVASDARNRLRLLNAQLDEAVARVVELSVSAVDVSELSPLSADVESLVSELESLRQGVEAVRSPG